MYIEKKKIGKSKYYYLRISARVKNKTKTKTIAYLGKEPMTKKEIEKKISAISKSKIGTIKKQLKQELIENIEDINKKFLTTKQMRELEKIKKNFNRKLRRLDKRLLEDMFKDFKTYYIYNTNAIEGNTLTLQDTNLLLNENKSPEGKDLREIHDHINERELFDDLLTRKPELSIKLMIEIHAKLLKNIDKRTGKFREHNVRVFGARFKTSSAKFVQADMHLLLRWYHMNKKKLHPLILAAIFHEKFERIHPFYDGNGRTGRILLNLILIRAEYPPLIIKNKTRKDYYKVLDTGHKAELTKTELAHYKEIVRFCYKQLLDSYENIFSKWG